MLSIISHLPKIVDHKIVELFDYWQKVRGDELIPSRQDVDPTQIRTVLPYIWIYERVDASDRFRCRLAGEEILARYNINIVGKQLEDFIDCGGLKLVTQQYLQVVEAPGIGHSYGRVYLQGIKRPGIGERIILPVYDSRTDNNLVVGATIYTPLQEGDNEINEDDITRTLTPLDKI